MTPECEERWCILYRRIASVAVWVTLVVFIAWQGKVISDSQARLRESHDRLFRIFHGSSKAVVVCNDKGRIIEYNQSAEEMLGWTRSEVVGKSIDLLIGPAHRKRHKEGFEKAVDALRRTKEDWRIVKSGVLSQAVAKDGSLISIMMTTRGIRYGDIIEFLATFERDAERKKDFKEGPLELPNK